MQPTKPPGKGGFFGAKQSFINEIIFLITYILQICILSLLL